LDNFRLLLGESVPSSVKKKKDLSPCAFLEGEKFDWIPDYSVFKDLIFPTESTYGYLHWLAYAKEIFDDYPRRYLDYSHFRSSSFILPQGAGSQSCLIFNLFPPEESSPLWDVVAPSVDISCRCSIWSNTEQLSNDITFTWSKGMSIISALTFVFLGLDLDRFFVSSPLLMPSSFDSSFFHLYNSRTLFFVLSIRAKTAASCSCSSLIGCIPFFIMGEEFDHTRCADKNTPRNSRPGHGPTSSFISPPPLLSINQQLKGMGKKTIGEFGCRHFPTSSIIPSFLRNRSSDVGLSQINPLIQLNVPCYSNSVEYIVSPLRLCFGERHKTTMFLFRINSLISVINATNISSNNIKRPSTSAFHTGVTTNTAQDQSVPPAGLYSSSSSILSPLFDYLPNAQVLQDSIITRLNISCSVMRSLPLALSSSSYASPTSFFNPQAVNPTTTSLSPSSAVNRNLITSAAASAFALHSVNEYSQAQAQILQLPVLKRYGEPSLPTAITFTDPNISLSNSPDSPSHLSNTPRGADSGRGGRVSSNVGSYGSMHLPPTPILFIGGPIYLSPFDCSQTLRYESHISGDVPPAVASSLLHSSLAAASTSLSKRNDIYIRINTYPFFRILECLAQYSMSGPPQGSSFPCFSPHSEVHVHKSRDFLKLFLSPFFIVMHVATGSGAVLPGMSMWIIFLVLCKIYIWFFFFFYLFILIFFLLKPIIRFSSDYL
jgi:hypothetical protein